jgi:hypothetical protein
MNSFTFLFGAMKETHEQHKAKIDIDELVTWTTNITLTDHANLIRDALGLTLDQVYQWRLLLEEYMPKIV